LRHHGAADNDTIFAAIQDTMAAAGIDTILGVNFSHRFLIFPPVSRLP